ncbi:MAG: hypothetical protein LBI67_04235 [Treponema sp.]|nr:hypothetical protein [Treponema sp.]
MLILLGLLVPFILVSCKTPPEDTDAGVDTGSQVEGVPGEDLGAPADAAALRLLGNARARAEAARAQALGVDAGSYFPDDWGRAESRYGEAGRAGNPANLGEARNQSDEWGRIARVYDDLYDRALPRFAEDKTNQLVAAREAALESGAMEILSDQFTEADTLALSARDKLENRDYTGAMEDGVAAYDRYVVLKTIADAHSLKEEADAYDFIVYDLENYRAGADAGANAVDLLTDGVVAEAKENADEALRRFGLVLENGWISYANEKSAAAQSWRQAALDAKANVAVRDAYQNAERAYNQAHVALRSGDFLEAADLFDSSGILFRQSRDAAVEKRVKAEEAIRQAEQIVSESEAKARSAQELIGDEE